MANYKNFAPASEGEGDIGRARARNKSGDIMTYSILGRRALASRNASKLVVPAGPRRRARLSRGVDGAAAAGAAWRAHARAGVNVDVLDARRPSEASARRSWS